MNSIFCHPPPKGEWGRMTRFSLYSMFWKQYFPDFDRSFFSKTQNFPTNSNLHVNFVMWPDLERMTLFALSSVWKKSFHFASNPNLASIFCHPLPKRVWGQMTLFSLYSVFWTPYFRNFDTSLFSKTQSFPANSIVSINFVIRPRMQVRSGWRFFALIRVWKPLFHDFAHNRFSK